MEEFEVAGLACLLLRHYRWGHWCGYVGVPPWHPAYMKHARLGHLQVHGDLNYQSRDWPERVTVAMPRRWRDRLLPTRYRRREAARLLAGQPPTLSWIGFDCDHHGDYSPRECMLDGNTAALVAGAVYRDAAFAAAEVRHLAEQLADPRGQALIWARLALSCADALLDRLDTFAQRGARS